MIINIKTLGLDLTPAISAYLQDKLNYVEKSFGNYAEETKVQVEVGKISKHHKSGEVFRAEINVFYRGRNLRAEVLNSDLYLAIEGMKDKIIQDVYKFEKKQNSLFRRGGRTLKGFLRGWRR
ncbi:MAG: ribosomal subunit interface protein [Candidatus Vogelbacteria bacterium CG22_combo_CG10-13_8_21_14_all_37_9]|uniref:Ribosomal subunit interface protein n=1 Tax=Candidatus Vogelbacteria bacterium CG22_combo_CG10-13_8_21_14_all_37_9 TaxID=1975046 RepID=A0A2H0BL07_9BACT|nr:MAG: ribosomal subunit interface protein [bacterium CG10_37_50]PIP58363.1 MAG: ribosomal subunit interface protein [Candidatus Vogelbacteria bacterium CG22_combo_CG10-13_8_21_14_all_37_9]